MRKNECAHCESWVKYDNTRYECARALSGFGCYFVSKDGYKSPTYEELEKANEYAKTIVKDLLNNSDEYARQRAMGFLEVKK